MKWFRTLLAAAGVVLFSVAASAALVDAGDVDVRFLANAPGLTIKGTGGGLKASESDGKLKITVPTGTLKTGIGLRDRHTWKALESDKYPYATLVVSRSKLKFPEDGKSSSGSATGDFTLHGVTKPLTFSYKAKRSGSDYHVQAIGQIDIRDYEVEPPCLLKVCVDPQVKLKLKFKLRDE